MRGEIIGFFIINKTNKEVSNVLFSVLKHSVGSGIALKK